LGGAFGGISAAIYGGDVGLGILYGAVSGAVLSAAVFGGYAAAEYLQAQSATQSSPAWMNEFKNFSFVEPLGPEAIPAPNTQLAGLRINLPAGQTMSEFDLIPSPIGGPGAAAIKYGYRWWYRSLNVFSRGVTGKPIEAFFRIERGTVWGYGKNVLHINIGGKGSGLPFNLHIPLEQGGWYRFWEWHK
jgi:hypothetical protein